MIGSLFAGCAAVPASLGPEPEPEPEASASLSSIPWQVAADRQRGPDEVSDGEDLDEPVLDEDEPGEDDDDARPDVELRVATALGHAERLVIWGPGGILYSEDDGASFTRILDDEAPLWGVAMGPTRVWALRTGSLHQRAADGTERSWPMPPQVDTALWIEDGWDDGGVAPRLAVSSSRVAVAVPDADPEHLAHVLTRRAGGSWSVSVAESTVSSSSIGVNGYTDLNIDERGRIRLTIDWGQGLSCAVGYLTTHQGRAGQATLRVTAEYEDAWELMTGHDRWAYTRCPEGDEETALCRHRPGAARPVDEPVELPWTPVEPVTAVGDRWELVYGHGRTVALADRSLVSLGAGRARPLVSDVSEDAQLLAVDARGRVLIRERGQIRRFTPGEGWMSIAFE